MANVGDKVRIITSEKEVEGILMPAEHTDSVVVKLKSGYNVGIKKENVKQLEVIEKYKEEKAAAGKPARNPKLKNITILHTGGTIASKIDYKTGGVVSRFSAEELMSMFPELAGIANIETRMVFQMFTEDMEPEHWTILAKAVDDELKRSKPDGIIIGIGTDTLEYVAGALSFALQNIPIPVLFVGSQRSSDRPSTDARLNLMCAAQFIIQSKCRGVFVCMHENENDESCFIIESYHVKKMHTSRRDTFRPINRTALASVSAAGKIKFNRECKNPEGQYELKNRFSSKVCLVKIHPGFRHEQLDWYEKNCEGLVIEGYAFGQLPINDLDEYTRHHPKLLEKVRRIAEKMPVAVVSQRPYGLTFMNVYSTSRDLLNAGVIEAHTQSHVAYAKLCWLLGNVKDAGKVREDMKRNINGEIVERTEKGTFLI